jgi:polyferredoxin
MIWSLAITVPIAGTHLCPIPRIYTASSTNQYWHYSVQSDQYTLHSVLSGLPDQKNGLYLAQSVQYNNSRSKFTVRITMYVMPSKGKIPLNEFAACRRGLHNEGEGNVIGTCTGHNLCTRSCSPPMDQFHYFKPESTIL